MAVFELMSRDVSVLSYDYDEGLHAIVGIRGVTAPEYAPPACVGLDGRISSADLSWWWRHRGIPASRPRLERLLETVGLDSVTELVERAMGLSLSDRYWVRPEGSGLRWRDVNFFDNEFSGALGDLTIDPLGGPGSGASSGDDLMSPNSTVLGNVPKKWVRREDGSTWLLKAPVCPFDQDVYNELVACSLYGRMRPPQGSVPYELTFDGSRPIAGCPNMLGDHEELVSAADLMRRHRRDRGIGTYVHLVDVLCESGLGRATVEEGLSAMFSCDYLLAGFDRHLGNFGLIRDCETLEYTGLAPIYDSGNSLWCMARTLSVPSDYDYRPQPFLGRQAESPERQLAVCVDYDWMPSVNLDSWADEAVSLLAKDPLMPESRLEAIAWGIRAHVARFGEHVERVASRRGWGTHGL